MTNIMDLAEKLNTQMEGNLEFSEGKQYLYINGEDIVKLMQVLKDDFEYKRLADIASVDYNDYFEVVYHLLDEKAELLEVKVKVEKDYGKIPSIVSIWKAADVQEREVYDMMGIIFEGHNNLKRILCKDDFEGHPLLKTFKLQPVGR